MNTFNLILNFNGLRLAGFQVIDPAGSIELVIRFALNFAVVLLLVRWLYYPATKRKDYLFTYLLISGIVFLLCFLLENVKIEIGFALGLFAVFGIIRYRTDTIPIKEMTYLFLVIGVSVINALANNKISITELIISNVFLILTVFCYEKISLLKPESCKSVVYENLDLIQPERSNELIGDLSRRTGIKKINRIEINRIDFVKNICHLTVFYESSGNEVNISGRYGNIIERDED